MMFCASCVGQGVGDAIHRVNSKGSMKDEMFRVATLREFAGLTAEDFGELLVFLQHERVTAKKDIANKLKWLLHRRLALWHVEGAPADKVTPKLGMSSYTWYAYLIISLSQTKKMQSS